MALTSILAGLAIAAVAAVLAEAWWRVLRPATAARVTACWMGGILTRVFVALAGLAICIGLFHLAAPPLVLAMVAGYAVALVFETRLTLRRLKRIPTAQTQPTRTTTTTQQQTPTQTTK